MSSSRVKALAFATACVAGSAIAAGIAYGAAGHLDRSFGGDGLVTIPTISGNADGVTTDARERVVAVGSCPDSACMVRYTPHGHLDHSFSGDGKVIAKGFAAEAVAMDAGRILMAGDTVFGRPSAFVVARYGPNGHLDRSFGRRGTATTNMGGNFEDVHAVAVDSKGRIVVAGYINSREHQSSIAIARYLPSGKLDHSFGTRGKVIRSFPAFGLDGQVAIDSRNRIVAASSDSRNHFELMRFRQSGRLDRSFGDNGAITRIRGIAKAVAIDRRDRIVAAGLLFPRQFVVARFRTGGGLDRTFGTGGKVISSPPGGRGAFVYAAAIGSGGGIFVAGRSDGRFTLARYTPSGSLDRSFAGDGFAQKPGGGANALAIDGAGRPVAAGFHDNQFAVARYKGH